MPKKTSRLDHIPSGLRLGQAEGQQTWGSVRKNALSNFELDIVGVAITASARATVANSTPLAWQDTYNNKTAVAEKEKSTIDDTDAEVATPGAGIAELTDTAVTKKTHLFIGTGWRTQSCE